MLARLAAPAIVCAGVFFPLRANAQYDSNIKAVSISSAGILFEVNGTTVNAGNYSSLIDDGGTYRVGFNGSSNPFRIVYGAGTGFDGNTLDVYGIRGVYLVDDTNLTVTHTSNTITPYSGAGNSTAFSDDPWAVEDPSGKAKGYATSNNGFVEETTQTGRNWLAVTPSGSVTGINSAVNKTWSNKPKFGDFSFTGLAANLTGLQLGLDVYGIMRDSGGNVVSSWGGTGKVRLITGGVPPDSLVPEGASYSLFLSGGLPALGVLLWRRKRGNSKLT